MYLKTTGQKVEPLNFNRKTMNINMFNKTGKKEGDMQYGPLYNDYEYVLVPLPNQDHRLGKTHTIQLINKSKLVDKLHG